jgi:thiamine kinase-like enzyme
MRPEVQVAASRYVPGTGPVELERIAVGEVNETWRVRRDGCDFALRLAGAQPADVGLDREWECRVLEAVAAAALAPRVERCLPRAGVLVMRWAAGARWTSAQVREGAHLARIAHLVRRIQGCRVPGPVRRRTPQEWIGHYAARLEAAGQPPRAHPLIGAQAALLEKNLIELERLGPTEPVLCHGDLHRDNLIDAPDGMLLIDWEYAHFTDPYWDLAGWCSNNALDPEHTQALLEASLGRTAEPAALRRLQILRFLYEYLCLLWTVLTEAQRPGGSRQET